MSGLDLRLSNSLGAERFQSPVRHRVNATQCTAHSIVAIVRQKVSVALCMTRRGCHDLISSDARFDCSTNRSISVPGWLIWISTRCPGLNPARSSHRPESRILGDTLFRQKSPAASIFKMRVFITSNAGDTGALNESPLQPNPKNESKESFFCA